MSRFFIDAIARLGVICMAFGAASAEAEWHQANAAIMGTQIHVEVWHPDADTAGAGIALVLKEIGRIDGLMSPHKVDSEVSQINAAAGADWVGVSAELARLLRTAEQLSVLSGGAFDLSFASAGHLYGYRQGVLPSPEQLRAATELIDFRQIELDLARPAVRLARPGMRIDLGGIAKGHAVERAAQLLQAEGFAHALISAGGDTRLVGDRMGRPWIVGVRHPRSAHKLVTRIPLNNEAISTSGDYERFFEVDGLRHHHIINPSTGDSARAVTSVTVIGPDATWTDGLSTALFVAGPETGLQWINALAGYEALVVDGQGQLHQSDGLIPMEDAP